MRRATARVSEDVAYLTTTELALAALDCVRACGVGRRVVLADAGSGTSHDFRTARCKLCESVLARTVRRVSAVVLTRRDLT